MYSMLIVVVANKKIVATLLKPICPSMWAEVAGSDMS
jgi:hypothetical protein